MAAGCETVSCLLDGAQKHCLVNVAELLEKSVEDLREEMLKYDGTTEPFELIKTLENCSHIYEKCDSLYPAERLKNMTLSLYDESLGILHKISQMQRKKTLNLQKVAVNTLRILFRRVSSQSRETLVVQCTESLQKHSEDRQFAYGAGGKFLLVHLITSPSK